MQQIHLIATKYFTIFMLKKRWLENLQLPVLDQHIKLTHGLASSPIFKLDDDILTHMLQWDWTMCLIYKHRFAIHIECNWRAYVTFQQIRQFLVQPPMTFTSLLQLWNLKQKSPNEWNKNLADPMAQNICIIENTHNMVKYLLYLLDSTTFKCFMTSTICWRK